MTAPGRTGLVVAALVVTATVAGCSTPDTPSGRAADTPILGVVAPPGGGLPECAEPVVHQKPAVSWAELTVAGQQGDVFGYRIARRDGTVVAAAAPALQPGQTAAIFTTGVANADIARVEITASGTVGVGGTCAITTIR